MKAVMSTRAEPVYEFGQFRLNGTERLLLREGSVVPLTPKAFDTLLLLVQNCGHVVTRDDLLDQVWRDSFVEENTVTQNVAALRRALGQTENGQQYIETVPKLGYRFVARVSELPEQRVGLLVERHTRERVVIRAQETIDEQTSDPVPLGLFERVKRHRVLSIAAVTLALIGVVTAVLLTANSSKTALPGAPIKSIAVLPFKNLSAETTDEYLGLGVADVLTSRLGKFKQIIVRPTNAVYKYGSIGQDPVAAGRELGVEAVLDGSIYKSGEKIRVTMQLVRVGDGVTTWSDKFDGRFQDILAAQDSLSNRVLDALRLNLSIEEKKQITTRHSESPEAYQAYMMGRYFWSRRTPEGHKKARQYFEQAVEQGPNYALAYAGLAGTHLMAESELTLEQKERLAIKALDIDDRLAEPHAILGFINMFMRHNWRGAEQELKRAIELDPNYATGHQWYAIYLETQGRLDEAETWMRHALEIDPLSLNINADLGELLYFRRDYSGALEQCLKTLDMDPTFGFTHYYLDKIYTQKGRYTEAADHFFKNIEFGNNPAYTVRYVASMREAYAKGGIRGLWRAHNDGSAGNPRVDLYQKAIHYALLGETDQALDCLKKEGFHVAFVKVEPAFDSLRSDARFTELLSRIGLGA